MDHLPNSLRDLAPNSTDPEDELACEGCGSAGAEHVDLPGGEHALCRTCLDQLPGAYVPADLRTGDEVLVRNGRAL